MDDARVGLLVTFIGYLLLLVVVGTLTGRRVAGQTEEFYLAGRRLPGWLVAFSAGAAGESGWVMMGLVGAGYSAGFGPFWILPGCVLGFVFNIVWLGPRLRAAAAETGALTVPGLISRRATSWQPVVRVLTALIIIVFLGAYVAAQFNAAGKAFEATLDLPYGAGATLGAFIVIAYGVLGGQRSIAWTHLLQAALMVIVLVVVPLLGLVAAGGVGGLVRGLQAADPDLLGPFGPEMGWAAVGLVLGWSGIGLGYPGQPHIVVHYMSGESGDRMRRAWTITLVWTSLVFAGAILSGIVVRGWIGDIPDKEFALPILGEHLFAPWMQGLVLAAILSAIASTADSQMHAVSAAIGIDLLGREGRRDISGWKKGLGGRIAFVAVGLAALGIALTENREVFDFVLFGWGVLGAGLGPILIALAWGRRVTGAGAVGTVLVGAVIAVHWRTVPALKGMLYELVPAFAVGLLAAFLLTSPAEPPEVSSGEAPGE